MYNITILIGTRPNYIKAYPIYEAFKKHNAHVSVIDSGQHWDKQMIEHAFGDWGMPIQHLNLHGSSREQIRDAAYACIADNPKPIDFAIVIGDTNSTLGFAWALKQHGIPFAHVEAGLRSGNWKMEEEFNRFVVDHLADINFATEPQAMYNIPWHTGLHVGNVLMDALGTIVKFLGWWGGEQYGILATLHRRENLNDENVNRLLTELNKDRGVPVTVVIHPHFIAKFPGIHTSYKNINFVSPMPYFDFIRLMLSSKLVVTDSGGGATEAFALNIPCLVYRKQYEHKTCSGPMFIVSDTNIGKSIDNLLKQSTKAEFNNIPFWSDGHASYRVASEIISYLDRRRNANI